MTCSEPLVWTCNSCGHSFHEDEWQRFGQACPACEKIQGIWKCSLCQNTLNQPALGRSHACFLEGKKVASEETSSSWLAKIRSLKYLLPAVFVFGLFLFLAFMQIGKRKVIPPSASVTPAVSTSLQKEETPLPLQEHVCNEGWRKGIVYDPNGVVNLRNKPDASAEIISKVQSGTPATFQDLDQDWELAVVYEMGFEDQIDCVDTVYVHKTRLFIEAKNTDPSPPTIIRAGPGYDTAIVGEVGVEVPIYMQSDEQTDWVVVVAGDVNKGFIHGFVRKELLKSAIE